MPKQVVFEDGYTYPWDDPSPEDYEFVKTYQSELDSRKADIQKQLHPGAFKTFQKFAKEEALPTSLSLAGGGLGFILAPQSPGISLAGITTGSLAGTWLNQQLGITEKDNTELIMSAMVPPALAGTGKVAKGGLKAVYRRMPGVPTAMNQIIMDRARSIPGKYLPTIPAEVLFKKVDSYGVKIPVDKLESVIKTTLRSETKLSTPNSDLINDLTRLQAKVQGNPQGLVPSDFHAEMSRFYENNQFHMKTGKPGFKGYGDVYNAFNDIIDTTLKKTGNEGTAALTLRGAMQTYKTEMANKRLADYIEKAVTPLPESEFDRFNPAAVIKKLRTDKNFNTSFTPEIRQEIYTTLRKMNKLPKESTLRNIIGQAGIGGVGLGTAIYNPMLGIMILGAEGGIITNQKLIAYAMTSESGRKLVSKLVDKGKGTITEKGMAVLGAYIASNFQEPILEEEARKPKLSKERKGLLPGQVPATKFKETIAPVR